MRGIETISDGEVTALCREGDEAAWTELVNRFSRYIYAILTRAYRLPQHEAEDVFQEVFSRAFDKLDSLRDDSAIKPWLAQMARRAAVDRIRASGREMPVEEMPEDATERELDRIDDAMSIQQAMSVLPEHCHEIVDRFFAQDQSYRTISEALDIPSGTIASRISRCLAKLKEHLGDFAGTGRK